MENIMKLNGLYDFIRRIVGQHKRIFGERFQGAVAFGPALNGSSSREIDLIELVDKWENPEVNPKKLSFDSEAEERVRQGNLRISVMSPKAFHKMADELHPVIVAVSAYYEVIEDPCGDVATTLEHVHNKIATKFAS